MNHQSIFFLEHLSNSFQGWQLEHGYAQLPSVFFQAVMPRLPSAPQLVVLNKPLAGNLGLEFDGLTSLEIADLLSGKKMPPGAYPIAQAYAGHQYGHFTGLGDGRAILLGEQLTPSGERFDIQLKGSGPTPYSRRGDGLAALGPMLREYLISEAMHAFGVPTTRSLAVVSTGDPVFRDEKLPGAVLVRVAASHLRFGTFEWAAAHRKIDQLKALADYAIQRHFPESIDAGDRYLKFLQNVIARQAALIARWQCLGFVHGVMNTDNMSICGETIDYGPCAFMDAYDPATVFSSIDRHGRYAYGKQPSIAQWNLAVFAEAILPLLDSDSTQAFEMAREAINGFQVEFDRAWLHGMAAKIGIFDPQAADEALIRELLAWMHQARADFTNTFRLLDPEQASSSVDPTFLAWDAAWRDRLSRQAHSFAESRQLMHEQNPRVIPRNHLVEHALEQAWSQGDLKPFDRLLEILTNPFDASMELLESEQQPAPAGSARHQTYCGT